MANSKIVLSLFKLKDAIAPKIDLLEPIPKMGPGEVRDVAFTYRTGDPPSVAFDIEWYLTEADAEACRNLLTDTENLPTTTFTPATPATDADPTEDLEGSVRFIAPDAITYENLFGKALIKQEDGSISPKIDLLEPLPKMSAGEVRDVALTYRTGDPPAHAFDMEWYLTEADAEACRNRLTDTLNLPRAIFTPETPAADAEPTEDLDGSVRLIASSVITYDNLVGKAIIAQDVKYKVAGGKFTQKISSTESPRRRHRPRWETY